MSSEDQKKIIEDLLALAGLFILAPLGYLIQIYILYKVTLGGESLGPYTIKLKIGLIGFLILPPIMHWLSYKHCQENFGWFKKK